MSDIGSGSIGGLPTIIDFDSVTIAGVPVATDTFKGAVVKVGTTSGLGTGTLTIKSSDFPSISETVDTNSWFNPSNGRFTPDIAGAYRWTIHASASFSFTATGIVVAGAKNGTTIDLPGGELGDSPYPSVGYITELNGSTDYLTFEIYSIGGAGWTLETLGITVEFLGTL